MPFIECHKCETVVSVSPVDEKQFHERFIKGPEPFLCVDCSRKLVDFRKWYKLKTDADWVEGDANMYGYAMELVDEYQSWCDENKQEPIWNG